MNAQDAVRRAYASHTIIPAFNIPYLPMVKPVAEAIRDEDSIAMIQVARLEWEKFASQSLEAVAEEYFRHNYPDYTLLHLDHVPAIDEDLKAVDFLPIIERAIRAGYQSVMVDGSRLSLDDNIAITKQTSELAHRSKVAVEAELGAVAGHESGGIGMSYEELFRSRKGFTKLDEAARFVRESGCDWLWAAFMARLPAAFATRKNRRPGWTSITSSRCRKRRTICRWCCTEVRESIRNIFWRRSVTVLPRSTWPPIFVSLMKPRSGSGRMSPSPRSRFTGKPAPSSMIFCRLQAPGLCCTGPERHSQAGSFILQEGIP